MRIASFFLAAMMLHIATAAHALRPEEMTPAERSSLPSWCEHTQSFRGPHGAQRAYNDYVSRYGPGWTHVHHYCWALASIIRYSRYDTTAELKRTLASSALADLDYVLRNAPEDFILRYEILARKIRLLVMIGEYSDAENLSETVRSKWPERADSYGLIAEVKLASNQRDDARRILDVGELVVKDKERLAQIRSALGL